MPLPFIPGQEGAGVVEDVGSAVKDFCKGDRVGYLAPGSYAEYTVVPEGCLLIFLPFCLLTLRRPSSEVAG